MARDFQMILKWMTVGLMVVFLLFVVVAIAVEASRQLDRVKADVTPHVVMPGARVKVTCRLRGDEDDRWIEVGVSGAGSSTLRTNYQKTFERTFSVDCQTGNAFCALTDIYGKSFIAQANVGVSGCDGP